MTADAGARSGDLHPERPPEPAAAAENEPGAIEPLEPASLRPRGPVARRIYTTGNGDLDRLVAETISSLQETLTVAEQGVSLADLELTREILTSSLRLVLQRSNRGS